MKRVLVIALAIVCGWMCSMSFAQKQDKSRVEDKAKSDTEQVLQEPENNLESDNKPSYRRRHRRDTVISVLDRPNDTIKSLSEEELWELCLKYLTEEECKEIFGK